MITPSFWKIRLSVLAIGFVVVCFLLGFIKWLVTL